jgi:hypothetical protein
VDAAVFFTVLYEYCNWILRHDSRLPVRSSGLTLQRNSVCFGFRESLPRRSFVLIRRRKPGRVYRLVADLRPAAPAVASHGSVLPWLLAAAVLAVIVAGGLYLTSRR